MNINSENHISIRTHKLKPARHLYGKFGFAMTETKPNTEWDNYEILEENGNITANRELYFLIPGGPDMVLFCRQGSIWGHNAYQGMGNIRLLQICRFFF